MMVNEQDRGRALAAERGEAANLPTLEDFKPPTLSEAKKILHGKGISMYKNMWGEFRVNYIGGSNETAYYTSDWQDAFNTGMRMYDERQRRISQEILAGIAKIAKDLGFDTLETRGRDFLDFRSVGVSNVKAALLKAYALGVQHSIKGSRPEKS
jgi:hypothetical protein